MYTGTRAGQNGFGQGVLTPLPTSSIAVVRSIIALLLLGRLPAEGHLPSILDAAQISDIRRFSFAVSMSSFCSVVGGNF